MGALVSPLMLDRLRTRAPTRDEAWAELYDQHYADLHRLIWRAGVTGAEAEELTQRVFIVAYGRIDDLDHLSSPGGWLRGIALRVVAGHRRWRRVRTLGAFVLKGQRESMAAPPSPEDLSEEDRQARNVQQLLAEMNQKHRDVLLLCDMEGLSPSEAAEALHIPVNTVRSRRRLAREEFGRLWRQRHGRER